MFTTAQRNAICTASTGCAVGKGRAPYYGSLGYAGGAVDNTILRYNLRINPEDWADKTNGLDFSKGTVSFDVEVWDGHNGHAGNIEFNVYRMPSGRYELVVYPH